jgi:hypothetical protein
MVLPSLAGYCAYQRLPARDRNGCRCITQCMNHRIPGVDPKWRHHGGKRGGSREQPESYGAL